MGRRYPSIHEPGFRIERELTWQQELLEKDTVLVRSTCIFCIRGAWDVAKKTYPNQVLYLMDKSRIMERHPNDRSHPKVASTED